MNRKRPRLEDGESTRMDLFGMLLSARMFESNFAPYCTTKMLACLLRSCCLMKESVLLLLTTRRMWPMVDVAQLSPLRRAFVRRLFYDSVTMDVRPRVLPSGLTGLIQITFCSFFYQPLTNLLPAGLKQVTLGRDYNEPVAAGVLPTSLMELTLGSDFNQLIVVGVLPAGLKQLIFGTLYNQPVAVGVLLFASHSLRLVLCTTSLCRSECCLLV